MRAQHIDLVKFHVQLLLEELLDCILELGTPLLNMPASPHYD